MKIRQISKWDTPDGREVGYVAEILLTREELERLSRHGFNGLGRDGDAKIAAVLAAVDADRRDWNGNGTLTEEGQRRYAHLTPIGAGRARLDDSRPEGRGEECAL